MQARDNTAFRLPKASSCSRRYFILTGLVCMVLIGMSLRIYDEASPDVQYADIAPTPLMVMWSPQPNVSDGVSPETEAKTKSLPTPAKNYSPAERNLLEKQRKFLTAKLRNHSFHPSLHAKSSADLTPAEGGTPVRNLIVSTWRSGSSFLDSVVASSFGTFLFYEPFMDVKWPTEASETELKLNYLGELFRCNFTKKESFFKTMKKKKWAAPLNGQFWNVCKSDKKTCITESYYEAACELFPFVLVKTVRLFMNETRQLLEDESLQLRILLLVRDPRGSMASRYRASSWCKRSTGCGSEEYLCNFLESNYYTTQQLMAQFPDRVKVVRYEDVMLDPYTTIRQIFDFFRLTYGDEVHNYLQKNDRYSANASVTPKKGLNYWAEELTFEQVSFIQSKCEAPLRLYGYKIAQNATHLLHLDPLDDFTLLPSSTLLP